MSRLVRFAAHSDAFRAVLVWGARVRRGRWGLRVSTPLHAASGVRPPFFIIGSGRSGNTRLRAMLNAPPELAIPPESYVLRDIAWLGRVFREILTPDQVNGWVMGLYGDRR